MSNGKVAVGEIVGFGRVWNPFRKKTKVLVNIEGTVVPVYIDYRQLDYFRRKYQEGSRVAVGFFGGEWHLGSPPAPTREYSAESDIEELDLLKKEMEDFDLMEFICQPSEPPAPLVEKWEAGIDVKPPAPARAPAPEAAVGEGEELDLLTKEMEGFDFAGLIGHATENVKTVPVPEKPAVEKPAAEKMAREMPAIEEAEPDPLDRIAEYSDYIRLVETNIKDNSSEILKSIGLGHLAPKGRAPEEAPEEAPWAQPRPARRSAKKKGHRWATSIDDRLDTLIAQNNEILANQSETLRLLRKYLFTYGKVGRSKNRYK